MTREYSFEDLPRIRLVVNDEGVNAVEVRQRLKFAKLRVLRRRMDALRVTSSSSNCTIETGSSTKRSSRIFAGHDPSAQVQEIVGMAPAFGREQAERMGVTVSVRASMEWLGDTSLA